MHSVFVGNTSIIFFRDESNETIMAEKLLFGPQCKQKKTHFKVIVQFANLLTHVLTSL